MARSQRPSTHSLGGRTRLEYETLLSELLQLSAAPDLRPSVPPTLLKGLDLRLDVSVEDLPYSVFYQMHDGALAAAWSSFAADCVREIPNRGRLHPRKSKLMSF